MATEAASKAEGLQSVEPSTGRPIAEVPCTPVTEVPGLAERARKAQVAWGKLSPRARGRAVCKIATVLADRGEEIADLITRETGKPRTEAVLHEVFPLADLARYFGKRAQRILAPRHIRPHLLVHKSSVIEYIPRGVVGIISPWNFPLNLGFGDVVMALAAGNGVVIKPSEVTPVVGLEMRKIVEQAGIDPELVQVATGDGSVGAALVRSGVNMIHFTGSVATGRKVAAACGEQLIPCVLELGGKDPALVLSDAPIESTARQLVYGAFANSGQACASIERAYVHERVYDKIVQRVVEMTKVLRQGDANQTHVDLGPMIFPPQVEVVKKHLDEAVASGARIECGGKIHDGRYIEPTVLTGLTPEMAIVRDETFGPMLPIIKIKSDEEAIAQANASPYGLNAYVFSKSVSRAKRAAHQLEAGSVMVNDVFVNQGMPETPWGGVKTSGMGRTHSDDGLRHLCEIRHVNHPWTPSFLIPWDFPYTPRLTSGLFDVVRGLYGSENLLRRGLRLLGGVSKVLRKAPGKGHDGKKG